MRIVGSIIQTVLFSKHSVLLMVTAMVTFMAMILITVMVIHFSSEILKF